MENPEDAKEIAKVIIRRATGRKLDNIIVESQKQINGILPANRGVRLDVLVSVPDNEGNVREVYDIEPNDYVEEDLAKRTRYYNSLGDAKLLKTKAKFDELPEKISIWILSYDPFGDNRMMYTVKNVVTENPELEYNDGVTNLFLYTRGKVGGSKELGDLLSYMEETTLEKAVDTELKSIQKIVESVKSDERLGGIYMTWEEILEKERMLARDRAIKEGREEGLAEGRAEGIAEGRAQGQMKGELELIVKKVSKGKTLSVIAEELESTVEEISEMYNLVCESGPEYNIDEMYEKLKGKE